MRLLDNIFGSKSSDTIGDAIATLPSCSLGCLGTYATSVNCTADDFGCQCKNPPNFGGGLTVSNCILTACSLLNVTATEVAFGKICGLVLTTNTTTSSISSTVSSSSTTSLTTSSTPSTSSSKSTATSSSTTSESKTTSTISNASLPTSTSQSSSPQAAVTGTKSSTSYTMDPKYIIAIVLSSVSLVLILVILIILLKRKRADRRSRNRNSMEDPILGRFEKGGGPGVPDRGVDNIRVEQGVSMSNSHYVRTSRVDSIPPQILGFEDEMDTRSMSSILPPEQNSVVEQKDRESRMLPAEQNFAVEQKRERERSLPMRPPSERTESPTALARNSEALSKLTGGSEGTKKPKRPPLAFFLAKRGDTPPVPAAPVAPLAPTPASAPAPVAPISQTRPLSPDRETVRTRYTNSYTPSENRAIGAVVSAFKNEKPTTMDSPDYRNSFTSDEARGFKAQLRAFGDQDPNHNVSEPTSHFSVSTVGHTSTVGHRSTIGRAN